MHNFMLGLLLGSLLTGTVVGAATFYDSQGHPNAPTGSVQQFDYFRARQFFLDQQAIRRNSDAMAAAAQRNPCAK